MISGNTIEQELARWCVSTSYDDIPADVIDGMKLLTRTIIGTTVAGSTAPGCEETVDLVKSWGGTAEASIWIHGGKAPVHSASMANSTMARALDICDAQTPGQHIGSSLLPVAIGVAELVGGVSGRDFLAALAVGSEIACRLGLVCQLDGFDPTGVCSVFASAIAAGRLLNLNEQQMLHNMALTFNRCGSSFQANIDGSLAVRLIEGFSSQNAVICAQLASKGLTGPENWLNGHWGFFHLYCKDNRDESCMAGDLGEAWHTRNFGYKTRPQCGATISSTDAILELIEKTPLAAEDIEKIDIFMATEKVCSLVGSGFTVGETPQVNGQFNVRYCVANAIVRGKPKLEHFSNDAVIDPVVCALAQRVETHVKPELMEGKFEFATRVKIEVQLKNGEVLHGGADNTSGFQPKPKTEDEHLEDFKSHVAYGGKPLTNSQAESIIDMTSTLDTIDDVRELLPLLIAD